MLAPPICWGCGAPARRREPLCRRCRLGLRPLPPQPVEIGGVSVWAPLAYEAGARELVRALKYRSATALADSMAAQIVASAAPPAAGAALVPVPLAPGRLRGRGFNQAALLAASLSRRTGLPVVPCLRRLEAGAPQVGRTRAERLAALAGSVVPVAGQEAPGRAVLVDDVVTTGATVAACAAALRSRGSREVSALAYARTLAR